MKHHNFQFIGELKIPLEQRAHFYTWSATMYRALCEATARTSESPGRLRRSATYKGLHPLRRFAAIPAPLPERYTRVPAVPFQRG